MQALRWRWADGGILYCGFPCSLQQPESACVAHLRLIRTPSPLYSASQTVLGSVDSVLCRPALPCLLALGLGSCVKAVALALGPGARRPEPQPAP